MLRKKEEKEDSSEESDQTGYNRRRRYKKQEKEAWVDPVTTADSEAEKVAEPKVKQEDPAHVDMGSIGIFWFSTLNEILESKDLYLPYVYHDGIHKWAIEKNRVDA